MVQYTAAQLVKNKWKYAEDLGVFDSKPNAESFVFHYNLIRGTKFVARAIPDPRWRDRERTKLRNGTYIPIPWDLPEIPDHFAHMSTVDGAKVAFTETPAKGEIDIQTRMTPGRYLTRFYPHLPAEEVTRLATMLVARFEEIGLKFAKTSEEIRWVYCNGPNSCMAYTADNFSSSVHPVEIYGAGDIWTAYVQRDPGRVSARCLVNHKKKLYSRVYGDEHRLVPLLKEAGYRYSSEALDRCLVKRIEDGGRLVAPYIDYDGGLEYVADDDKHMRIVFAGYDFECQCTNGYTSESWRCERCNDTCDEDDSFYIDDANERWCADCTREHAVYCNYYGEYRTDEEGQDVVTSRNGRRLYRSRWSSLAVDNHAFYCDRSDEYFSREEFSYVEMANGETWEQSKVDTDAFFCEGSEAYYPFNEYTPVLMNDGSTWEKDYFDENGFTCAETGGNYPSDEGVTLPDGRTVCRSWFEAREAA